MGCGDESEQASEEFIFLSLTILPPLSILLLSQCIADILPLNPSRRRLLPSFVTTVAHFLPLIALFAAHSFITSSASPRRRLRSITSTTTLLRQRFCSMMPLRRLCSVMVPQICDVDDNFSPALPLFSKDDDSLLRSCSELDSIAVKLDLGFGFVRLGN
ncbi:uncharacterized protein DS421_18g604460 [Arachis hypogaea]|nr:uncharacterized protein DS421_18g604460 [Arachis hypogaea]